jgi:hypothetical protein
MTPFVTPAMEAGIADHVWAISELLAKKRQGSPEKLDGPSHFSTNLIRPNDSGT